MSTVWCPECLLAFSVTRDNSHKLTSPQVCTACKGSGEVVVKDEEGKPVQGRCPYCEGEKQLAFGARCTHTRSGKWCQRMVLIPVKTARVCPWLGKKDPRTREGLESVRRSGVDRSTREMQWKARQVRNQPGRRR